MSWWRVCPRPLAHFGVWSWKRLETRQEQRREGDGCLIHLRRRNNKGESARRACGFGIKARLHPGNPSLMRNSTDLPDFGRGLLGGGVNSPPHPPHTLVSYLIWLSRLRGIADIMPYATVFKDFFLIALTKSPLPFYLYLDFIKKGWREMCGGWGGEE